MPNSFYIVCCILLLIVAAGLLLRLVAVKRGLAEIAGGLEEKLNTETNTPLTVSTGDKGVRELASALNGELDQLRMERLKLSSGEKELKTAVTNIAHDLRTPLTVVNGYLQMLENEEKSETVEKYLNIIGERCDAMKILTEEMFSYSIANAKADNLVCRELCLNHELGDALAESYELLVSKGIEPVVEICEEEVLRKLDHFALQRIFANIISNAVKYSEGDFSVRLGADGVVEFANRAPSLTDVELAKLFDRFYTVNDARESTGLGLSIARLLTEKMGGEIGAVLDDGVLKIRVRF